MADLAARRFALLGEPTRLRLLDELHDRGEASVGALARAIGASHANVSKHLHLLLDQRMVERRREGSHAFYRISDPTLMQLCDTVCASIRDGAQELTAVLGGTGR